VKNNPILLYKPQGVEPEGELQGLLSKDNFYACMQTSFQRVMLIKLGTDAVCMGSTHGTNVYDFNLLNLGKEYQLHGWYAIMKMP